MDVEKETAQGDRVRLAALFHHIPLRHDKLPGETAGLADIKMVGPMAIVRKFVGRESPRRKFRADRRRNFCIVHHEPQVAVRILTVRGGDAAPLRQARLRP